MPTNATATTHPEGQQIRFSFWFCIIKAYYKLDALPKEFSFSYSVLLFRPFRVNPEAIILPREKVSGSRFCFPAGLGVSARGPRSTNTEHFRKPIFQL